MDNPVTVYNFPNGEILKIYYDIDPVNPREMFDNCGHMICWCRRYSLGDTHEFTEPDDFKEWWDEHGKHGLCLPLYLYDHSGITMNTTGFSSRWDSGQVGWIYITADEILNAFGSYDVDASRLDVIAHRPGKTMLEHAKKVLIAEVADYDTYIKGEIYGFVLEDAYGNEIDSCWGFFGNDINTNGILNQLGPKQRNALLNEGAKA